MKLHLLYPDCHTPIEAYTQTDNNRYFDVWVQIQAESNPDIIFFLTRETTDIFED